MKSLFTRFKQPVGSNGSNGGGSGTRSSVLLDEKDAVRPQLAAVAAVSASDATVRISQSRSQPVRSALPADLREPRDSPSSSFSNAPSSSGDKPLPARPTTPAHGLSSVGPLARAPNDDSSSSERNAPTPSVGPRSSSLTGQATPSLAAGVSSTSLAGESDRGVDWPLRPQHRMSMDNVKKVMFRSPQRQAHASDTDLRTTMAGPSSLRHQRRASSPHRATSPSKQLPVRSGTPTQTLRAVSRSSSRQSTHVRKPSGTGSSMLHSGLSHSPTKSTVSTLAPSDSSTMSTASYLPIPESWTAAMDEELIANLGPRERNRQEVLWEIVNSEERYVQDLYKLNETFCKALLPQPEQSPSLSLPDPLALSRTMSSATDGSDARLPIAAQFASQRFSSDSFRDAPPTMPSVAEAQRSDGDAARQVAYDTLTRAKTKEPHPASSRSGSGTRKRLSFNTNSKRESGHGRKSSIGSITADGPVTLPDDLEQVLTVVSTGILEGHIKQATALRKRYDEEFPLVRSLADVFTSHSEILREYATYILHLERALAQVDEAMAIADQIATGGRRSSRRLEETPLGRLSKLLVGLEDLAAERGEACLSISLSKPFQRLLKYPLLFQNLLYHTSPSTKEYEATLAMVAEVQRIVRSIEDEKSSSEEREKTRDAWARIDGLEKAKQLMAPRPNRLLVSETNLTERKAAPSVRERKSQHLLGDILKKVKPDQWLVKFTDVTLLCEINGTTTLPMSTTKATNSGLKSESVTDLSSKRKSKRHQSLKARNLYKFVKVYEWSELPPRVVAPRLDKFPWRAPLSDLQEGKAVSPSRTPDRTVPLKTGDESPSKLARRAASISGTMDDTMSDRMSVMSFAFRGEARPNPAVRVRKSTTPPKMRSSTSTLKTATAADRRASSGMESAAASAKFAHRLRPNEDVMTTVRPGSRVRRSLPPAMAALSPTDRSNTRLGSPTRPPWNSGTRPASVREVSRPGSAVPVHPLRPRTSASGGLAGATIASTAKGKGDEAVGLGISDAGTSTESIPAGVSAATAARIARRHMGGHI